MLITEESKRSGLKLSINFVTGSLVILGTDFFVVVVGLFLSLSGKYLGVGFLGHMSNFLRNCKTIFQCNYVKYSIPKIYMRVPGAPYPHQHPVLPDFLFFFNSFIRAKLTNHKYIHFKSYFKICIYIHI